MTDRELFDSTAVHDDEQSWDAFASRVTAEAIRRRGSVLHWLAGSRAAAVAIAVVLGALAVLLTASRYATSDPNAHEQWTRLLAPSDAVGRTIATADRPPTIARLLDEARGGGR